MTMFRIHPIRPVPVTLRRGTIASASEHNVRRNFRLLTRNENSRRR